jgi:putative ABC transport system permease protein
MESGLPENALVRRAGSASEMDSVVTLEQERVIENAPGLARSELGPLISPEVIVIATFPLKSGGTDANVQVRGVSPSVLEVRKNVRILAGRFFHPGLNELVVGRNATNSFANLALGDRPKFGGAYWKVVGLFESGGSAFDSEVWCDPNVLNDVYHEPKNLYGSVTVHLTSPEAFTKFREALTSDPRLAVQVEREKDYYDKQSQTLTTLIVNLGTLVALVMGIGAVFGALNTMYSAVAERSREIATMRAVGFGGASVVASFLLEALMIAFFGGLLGCIAALPLNGVTAETMNLQTFSHLAFAFRVTPALLLIGLVFALLVGVVGGMLPAIRAARRPIAPALRSV